MTTRRGILGLAWGLSFFVVSLCPARGDVQAGKAVYTEHCLKCHGEKGKGDGPSAKKLKMKMADYTNVEAMAKFSDEDMKKITLAGGEAVGKSKLMPDYKDKLSAQQVADVVEFIRTLAKK